MAEGTLLGSSRPPAGPKEVAVSMPYLCPTEAIYMVEGGHIEECHTGRYGRPQEGPQEEVNRLSISTASSHGQPRLG